MKATVRKWGNSAAVRIPSAVMRAARLALGEAVDIREEAGRVVIEPIHKRKCELAKLVKGITSKNRHEAVDFRPPAGQEIEGTKVAYQLTPSDPAFKKKMLQVEKIIGRYRNALRTLAK